MPLTIGERKAAVFLRAVAALEDLKAEIRAESTTHPRHVEWVQRIEHFVEELLTAAEATPR